MGNCQSQDACPIRSPIFFKPCWWKAAFPGMSNISEVPGPTVNSASFEYAVADVIIRIHQVEFTGAGASELPLLQAAAEKLSGRDYYRALLTCL